jgi:DNA-binding MarR family transcriptional regulator
MDARQSIEDTERVPDGSVEGLPFGADAAERLLRLAQHQLRQAARRSDHLPMLAAGDPQWRMLLDLFAASLRGKPVQVLSLCLASGAAPATAWRHVRLLERAGLIVRTPHPRDGRSAFLRLAPATLVAIAAHLTAGDQDYPTAGSKVRGPVDMFEC